MKGLTILKREELHLIGWFSLAFLIKPNIYSTVCVLHLMFSVEERTRIVFALSSEKVPSPPHQARNYPA
jgi:hypothetical protein